MHNHNANSGGKFSKISMVELPEGTVGGGGMFLQWGEMRMGQEYGDFACFEKGCGQIACHLKGEEHCLAVSHLVATL